MPVGVKKKILRATNLERGAFHPYTLHEATREDSQLLFLIFFY